MPKVQHSVFLNTCFEFCSPPRLRRQTTTPLLLHSKQAASRQTQKYGFLSGSVSIYPELFTTPSPLPRGFCRVEGRCQEAKPHSTRLKVILGTWKSPTIKQRKTVATAKSAYFRYYFLGRKVAGWRGWMRKLTSNSFWFHCQALKPDRSAINLRNQQWMWAINLSSFYE